MLFHDPKIRVHRSSSKIICYVKIHYSTFSAGEGNMENQAHALAVGQSVGLYKKPRKSRKRRAPDAQQNIGDQNGHFQSASIALQPINASRHLMNQQQD